MLSFFGGQTLAKSHSTLDSFLNGQQWSQVYARKSLPILVHWAETHKTLSTSGDIEHTYSELARAVGQPKHARVISEALGTLGFALRELSQEKQSDFDEIPPIQLIVWSKGKGSPGHSGFGFLNFSPEEAMSMPAEARQALAQKTRRDIVDYSLWRRVLKELGLAPLVDDELPDMTSALRSIAAERSAGGESPEHKRLKHYLKDNPSMLKLSGVFDAGIEKLLLSGDKADLLFVGAGRDNRTVCVEVKSRISSETDLMRGLFQCVKYRSVLRAHNTFEANQNREYIHREIKVVLVTEEALPKALLQLSKSLDVPVMTIRVPDSYRYPETM